MRNIAKTLFTAVLVMSLASCAGIKQITYFQDTANGQQLAVAPVQTIKVGVSDRLSIVVHSKTPELASIFNLPIAAQRIGVSTDSSFGSGSNQLSSYTVDENGDIDFPILGKIHVAGLTREDIAAVIKDQIIRSDYIKDAVVIVEFSNLNISVLGQVAHPGRFSLDKDHMTILDAIAKAGDLTIDGLRKNVKVYREENGAQKCYAIDLTSGADVFTSPVYYLRQDDVIYVEPNGKVRRSSTVNGNTALSASFWVSIGSFLLSITTMVLTINNKKG